MSQPQITEPLRAELAGQSTAAACGITARGESPVLALCRKLIEAGHDPATPLDAFRGETLCLRIKSIGRAAGLEVNSHGTGFIRYRRAPKAVRASKTAPHGVELSPLGIGHGTNGAPPEQASEVAA